MFYSKWVQTLESTSSPFQLITAPEAMIAGAALGSGRNCRPFVSSDLFFDLTEIQFHRCRPTKNGHGHTQLAFLVIDVFDVAGEILERTIDDTHRLALLESQLLRRIMLAVIHALQNDLHFL